MPAPQPRHPAPDTRPRELRLGRGWRRFLTASATGVVVSVDVGGRRHDVCSDRGGYVDAVLAADLPPGWAEATFTVDGGPASTARVRVVDPGGGLGVVSDIAYIPDARLRPLDEPRVAAGATADFFRLVKAGFYAPRKQLHNSLARGLNIEPAESRAILEAAGIDSSRRPAMLSLEEWASLARAWQDAGRPAVVHGTPREVRAASK